MEFSKRPSRWITFISVMFILLGVYGSVRTVVNFAAFEKYPAEGIFNIPFLGQPSYYPGRESDCSYPMMYYRTDGLTPREPNSFEKEHADQQKKQCMDNVTESRRSAKVKDISQSVLFLFLGAGLMATRKLFEE